MRHNIVVKQRDHVTYPGSRHYLATCSCGWAAKGHGSHKLSDENKIAKRHIRNQCPMPGKKAFSSYAKAQQSLSTVLKRGRGSKLPSRIYQCQCSAFHLTSQPKRFRSGVAA